MVRAACRGQAMRAGRLDILATQAQLVAPQVVVERLHIGEDALGVGLLAHDHHVLHIHQGDAVHQHPARRGGGTGVVVSAGPNSCSDPLLEGLFTVKVCWFPIKSILLVD